MSNDTLGDRMKAYEDCYRIKLPRRSNVIIRIDGKAFHTYTRNLARPFDAGLASDMDYTAASLLNEIQGAKLAYVQSDEINILVTDYDTLETSAWFDNNLQKMASVAASAATAHFNEARIRSVIAEDGYEGLKDLVMAQFDARVFVIPEIAEVANLFLWRCQDAKRNSIQMFARSVFSQKDLHCKNCDQILSMLDFAGNSYLSYVEPRYRLGAFVTRGERAKAVPECTFDYWHTLIKGSIC